MVRKAKQPAAAKPAATQAELTPLELEIMTIVWERGTANAAEVGEALPAQRPLAATTIHTVLANLRKKGFIEPIPTVERALRFAPCVPREQVATQSLGQLIRNFFGGSPERLMAHMIKSEQIDAQELAEIRKLFPPAVKGKKDTK